MILTKSVSFNAWQFAVNDPSAYKYLGLLQTATKAGIKENLPDVPLKSVSVGVNDESEYSAYVETYPINTPNGNVPSRLFTIKDGQWLIEDDTLLGTYHVVDNNELLLLVSK